MKVGLTIVILDPIGTMQSYILCHCVLELLIILFLTLHSLQVSTTTLSIVATSLEILVS